MEKFGDIYLDFNQNENQIEDINLNAIWVDLDKGLLSDNIGLQSEFIVKLTELFEKFPLPVFVNSGFLRLAKIFQNGNNYLKLQVIRVIEKNHKHLEKIMSIDEICKLIFHNIHSNDSVCRALTLRALAEISHIISDRHNVQHSIRLALESHDDLEAREAIYAANKFCSVSRSFAVSLFERLTEIIEDIQSPLHRKLKLIPLLIHMHHDTVLSSKAKSLCKAMYYSYPRPDIDKIIITTITMIACKSMMNISETVEFFVKLLHEEYREKLNFILLNNLKILAKLASHLWKIENINSFVDYINSVENNEIALLKASEILFLLAMNKNPYFNLYLDDENFLRKEKTLMSDLKNKENKVADIERVKLLIVKSIFHENKQIALNFCLLAESILLFNHKQPVDDDLKENENSKFLFDLSKSGLFSIILKCDKYIKMSKNEDDKEAILKKSLRSAINLVELDNQSYIESFYLFVSSLLNNIESPTAAYLYIDTLLSLCRFEIFHKISDSIRKECCILNILSKCKESTFKNELNLQLKVINLLFELQLRIPNFLTNKGKKFEGCSNDFVIKEYIFGFLENNIYNLWFVLKLARMCVRYSCYELACEFFNKISTEMSSVNSDNIALPPLDLGLSSWLKFMGILCRGEYSIIQSNVSDLNEFIRNLNDGLLHYNKGLTLFKSNCMQLTSSEPVFENCNTCFQTRFCELRGEEIKLYIHIILSTMTYQTIPAPIFHFKSSENFGKFGRVAQQIKYSIIELQKLSQKYKELISECFDADTHTLNILNIHKKKIDCLIFCTNLLSSQKNQDVLSEEFLEKFLNKKSYNSNCKEYRSNNTDSVEIKTMEMFYEKTFEKVKQLSKQDSNSSDKINQIKQFQEILIEFIQLPISLPRAFFNTIQKTQIKLITFPTFKKNNTNLVTIKHDQNLVIKIDGIINQKCKFKELIRKIKKIQICLTIEHDNKSNDSKVGPIKYTDLKTRLETPKNDYFNCNMIINFPFSGNFTLQLDLYIVDEQDIVWHYLTERQHMIVKVEEDPLRQKIYAAMVNSSSNIVNGLTQRTNGINEFSENMEI